MNAHRFSLYILFLTLLLASCTAAPEPPPTSTPSVNIPTRTLPPLLPTNTPLVTAVSAQPTLAPTGQPETLAATEVPVDFSQPVISFRYHIPAVGLDRRFEGTVASNITLTDATTGEQEHLRNRGGILFELQSALTALELADLPAGCDACVQFTFDMPVEGLSGEGWLQDPILLASVENFLSVWLGPHFPPDTAVGLHRSASGYNVAHTVAILEDGQVWGWQATASEVSRLPDVDPTPITQRATELPLNRLEQNYVADCQSYPKETLLLTTAAETQRFNLKCPTLSLPTTLTTFYQQLDALAATVLDPAVNLPFPDPLLPLDAVAYYHRVDGANLTLYPDGRYAAEDPVGIVSGGTLTTTQVMSLTTALITSDVIPRGVSIVAENELDELEVEDILLVRGELGVYEFGWSDNIGPSLVPEILDLQRLLAEEVGFLTEEDLAPTPVLTATETVTGTPAISATVPLTSTPTLTATRPVTGTPTQSP